MSAPNPDTETRHVPTPASEMDFDVVRYIDLREALRHLGYGVRVVEFRAHIDEEVPTLKLEVVQMRRPQAAKLEPRADETGDPPADYRFGPR